MILLAIGKKGSGKSALLRKICSQALRQGSLIFYHDPNEQLRQGAGKVYTSIDAWVADPEPTLLSIFRDVEPEDIAALALRVKDVTVVLDEMDQAFVNKSYGVGARSSAIRKIIHEGRHYRVNLWGGFRRTANVSEDLMSQSDYVFLLRANPASPSDITAIEKRLGPAFAAAAQRFEFGQVTVWCEAVS